MIESPILQMMRAETIHAVIRDILKDRFGSVRRDVTKELREALNEKQLRKLSVVAGKRPDLEAFRQALLS